MPITRQKKKEVIDNLKNAIKDSSSVVFVNFKGLNVFESSEMRRALKANGVKYTVAKKSLTRKALEGEKVDGVVPALDGEIAIAYLSPEASAQGDGSDSITPAREVYQFQKKFDGKINIVGGIFEGGYKDKESMMSIAMIPPLQVLYGQFVNLINSPIQGLVLGLNAIADKGTK